MKIRLAAMMAISVVLGGCATTVTGVPMAPEMRKAVFYIEKQPTDSHDLDLAVEKALSRRGISASTIEPESYDYVVRYVDQWYWDMRMYLLDFRVDVRDARSNVLVATGRSYQTSTAAMGIGRTSIIERAIAELLKESGGSED